MQAPYGTLEDVADLLNISTDTVWRWVADGYLPSIALGRDTGKSRRRRTLRFDMDDVRLWAEEQRRPGESKSTSHKQASGTWVQDIT